MDIIDNMTKTLKDDLSVEIKKGSRMSVVAACFSIYAFQELKRQLIDIDELRFIFTSPVFVAEKTKNEKREFYIPRLYRERSLYGTEFEIKLRNKMTLTASVLVRHLLHWRLLNTMRTEINQYLFYVLKSWRIIGIHIRIIM